MTAHTNTILVAGEALVDLIPPPGGGDSLQVVLGGSPFNTAIGLGRMGVPTAYAGRLSLDVNGDRFAQALSSSGVSLEHVLRAKAPSPLAYVTPGTAASGPRYAFYLRATAYDGPSPLPRVWPAAVAHLHVGSFAALAGKAGEATLAAFKLAKKFASTSFDPNIRPFVLPPQKKVVPMVEERVALSGIVKASDEDLEWLYPGRDPMEAAAFWAKAGPRLVVLTRGSKGATALAGKAHVTLPAPAIKLIDTVGAGDSFMSALLAIMHEEAALGVGLRVPDAAAMARWVAFAIKAAAITCGRKGANPPLRDELRDAAARPTSNSAE